MNRSKNLYKINTFGIIAGLKSEPFAAFWRFCFTEELSFELDGISWDILLLSIMPHQKHVKNNRQNGNRNDANNNVPAQRVNDNHAPAGVRNPVQGPRMVKCCVPGSCPVSEELIDSQHVGDAVRVFCNSEGCDLGNWMHKSCFVDWEQSVLSYLRSCGRARSWSEKQRLQNLWTKKGYDLAFKACDCNCGRGHLRKDLDYIPPIVDNAPKKVQKKKKPAKPELNNANVRERRSSGNGNTTANGNVTLIGSRQNANLNATTSSSTTRRVDAINGNAPFSSIFNKSSPSIEILQNDNFGRFRADSVGSTGSSPPNSASSCNSGSGSPTPNSPSQNPYIGRARSRFDFTETASNPQTAATIFRKRIDLSAFNILPKHKQNSYHIKMEDDTANGNDDVRSFVLNHLSSYKMSSLSCVLCKNEMTVFDRYPLVDGTLFLSPQAYDDQVLRVISEGRLQFINAVCVSCLEGGTDIRCAACKRKWDGSALLLGTMYSYDIFAAMPCCQKRLTCKHCRRAVVDVSSGLQYFSEYSHMIPCPYCKAYDYHFIRPLSETFALKMSTSIWN